LTCLTSLRNRTFVSTQVQFALRSIGGGVDFLRERDKFVLFISYLFFFEEPDRFREFFSSPSLATPIHGRRLSPIVVAVRDGIDTVN
jgi:hypothetical protein